MFLCWLNTVKKIAHGLNYSLRDGEGVTYFYKPADKTMSLGEFRGEICVIFAFTNQATSSMRSSEFANWYVIRQL